jgi:hypothetical protein
MMQPPTSIPLKKLQIRAYDCKLTAQKVKRALLKLVETSPAFNESWINGEFDIGSRIGGLNQFGDIIVRHRTVLRGKHELTIEHRAGDELLAKEIEAAYGKDLTPKAPRMIKGKKRPHGMAYFFEMIRSSSLKKDLIIADAVIENAHDLDFDDYRGAREKLGILSMVPRIGSIQSSLDVRIQRIYKEATEVHTKPKFCLHEGQKVALRHRLVIIPTKHDRVMTLYFAKLPGFKILVGWVEERAF